MCSVLRDLDEFGGGCGGGQAQLDLATLNGDLGVQAALVVKVGVHFQSGVYILGDVGAKLGHKLHGGGWHKGNLILVENIESSLF